MTIPFRTTDSEIVAIAEIVVEMKTIGLETEFIAAAAELARVDQGVYDLMALWNESGGDASERDEIVAILVPVIKTFLAESAAA